MQEELVQPLGRQVRSAAYKRRRSIKAVIKEILAHLALLPLAVVFMLPFFWMVSTSLKSNQQVFAWPLVWIPNPMVWKNYPEALQFFPFWLFLRNTMIIAGFSVLGAIFSTSVVAYSLACIPWKGREFLFLLTLSTMMLPYQVTMIPLFITFSNLGMVDTFYPLIIPSFLGSAFFIFLLRQFFRTIPQDLIDAARIDGAGHPRIYAQIIMPLAKPALFTIALFQFLNSWRNFLGPLIYLSKENMYTISLGLQYFRLERDTEWQLLMAASIMLTGPIIVLFFFTQRTFVQGITMTGIKG